MMAPTECAWEGTYFTNTGFECLLLGVSVCIFHTLNCVGLSGSAVDLQCAINSEDSVL